MFPVNIGQNHSLTKRIIRPMLCIYMAQLKNISSVKSVQRSTGPRENLTIMTQEYTRILMTSLVKIAPPNSKPGESFSSIKKQCTVKHMNYLHVKYAKNKCPANLNLRCIRLFTKKKSCVNNATSLFSQVG